MGQGKSQRKSQVKSHERLTGQRDTLLIFLLTRSMCLNRMQTACGLWHVNQGVSMAIFYISAWQGAPDASERVWETNVLALSVEEAYRLGRSRLAAEQPDWDLTKLTLLAEGDSVTKSIEI